LDIQVGKANSQHPTRNIEQGSIKAQLFFFGYWLFLVHYCIFKLEKRIANTQHGMSNKEGKAKGLLVFLLGYWLFLVRYWIFKLEKRIANTQHGISNKEGKAKRPACFFTWLLVIPCSLLVIRFFWAPTRDAPTKIPSVLFC
jgi:hypothetical protein